MSAFRTSLNMTQNDWEEMDRIRRQISSGITGCNVCDLERFSELFARNLISLNENTLIVD